MMFRFIFILLCLAFIGLLRFAYELPRIDDLRLRQTSLQESLTKAKKASLDEGLISNLKQEIEYLTQEIEKVEDQPPLRPDWFYNALITNIIAAIVTLLLRLFCSKKKREVQGEIVEDKPMKIEHVEQDTRVDPKETDEEISKTKSPVDPPPSNTVEPILPKNPWVSIFDDWDAEISKARAKEKQMGKEHVEQEIRMQEQQDPEERGEEISKTKSLVDPPQSNTVGNTQKPISSNNPLIDIIKDWDAEILKARLTRPNDKE